MSVDREQIRRDSERWLARFTEPHMDAAARACLALLVELEQAERQLAAVPALVEALRPFLRDAAGPTWLSIGSEHNTAEIRVSHRQYEAASDALAAVEQAQERG